MVPARNESSDRCGDRHVVTFGIGTHIAARMEQLRVLLDAVASR